MNYMKKIIEKAISCGIPIYNLKSKKPSTTFFQSFGMFIKKNIIDLNKEQTIYYIDGKDILIVQNEKKYVLVKYKEFSIGCGLIKDNILKECKRFQKVLNEIILLNRPLIYPIVRYYAACKQIDHDDLVQEGIFALRRAAIGFDRGRGIKFSTYANPWIRQIIQRSIAYNKTIRVPIHIALLGERIETIGRLNFRKGVKQLTLEELQEIALKYGWGIKKMRTAIEVTYQKHISLEDKVDNEDKITDPSNKLPGITGQISVEDLYATIETNYIFMKNLATLSPKMEYVMRKRFIDNYTL